jgi:Fe-S-cluster containining protein
MGHLVFSLTHKLPVLNLDEARFECTFGRGCEGLCCRQSRPPVEFDEAERIQRNLHKFIPLLRPGARRVIQRKGFLSGRKLMGQPTLRVTERWCVFFNKGCILHQVGVAEGDKLRYKPVVCSLFPLELDDDNRWFVRQKGFQREKWDLPCLDPTATDVPASESLQEELAIAERVML